MRLMRENVMRENVMREGERRDTGFVKGR